MGEHGGTGQNEMRGW